MLPTTAQYSAQVPAYVNRHTIALWVLTCKDNPCRVFAGATIQKRHVDMTIDDIWQMVRRACQEEEVYFPETKAREDFEIVTGEEITTVQPKKE
jgi:hypothetical protein